MTGHTKIYKHQDETIEINIGGTLIQDVARIELQYDFINQQWTLLIVASVITNNFDVDEGKGIVFINRKKFSGMVSSGYRYLPGGIPRYCVKLNIDRKRADRIRNALFSEIIPGHGPILL